MKVKTYLFLAYLGAFEMTTCLAAAPVKDDELPGRVNCYFCNGYIRPNSSTSTCNSEKLQKLRPDNCNGFCHTRFIARENGNGVVNVKRGCSDFDLNNCQSTENRNGEKFSICVKSCDEDLCNTDDSSSARIIHSIATYWLPFLGFFVFALKGF